MTDLGTFEVFEKFKDICPDAQKKHNLVLNLSKKIIKHPTDKKNLNDFIQSGGLFIVLKGGYSYSPKHNLIYVDEKTIINLENTDIGKLELNVAMSHELKHFSDISKISLKFPDFRQLYDKYDIKTLLMSSQVLEAMAMYHTLITSFETGQKNWDFFIKYKPFAANVSYSLAKNNIRPGNKIPEEYLSFVADTAFLAFIYNFTAKETGFCFERMNSTGLSYQYNFLKIKKKNGNKSLNFNEIYEIIGNEITYSKKLIENLFLLDRRLYIPKQTDIFSKIDYKNEKKIAKKLFDNYFNNLQR